MLAKQYRFTMALNPPNSFLFKFNRIPAEIFKAQIIERIYPTIQLRYSSFYFCFQLLILSTYLIQAMGPQFQHVLSLTP